MVALTRRGEVWLANLNQSRGTEPGKTRPVLIVQADALTQAGLSTLLAVPLTTQARASTAPLRIAIPARGRLQRDSWAMADQLRALDRGRFGDGPLALITDAELAAVEPGLRAALGLL